MQPQQAQHPRLVILEIERAQRALVVMHQQDGADGRGKVIKLQLHPQRLRTMTGRHEKAKSTRTQGAMAIAINTLIDINVGCTDKEWISESLALSPRANGATIGGT